MKPRALALLLAALGLGLSFGGAAAAQGERVRACVSPGQARDLLIEQQFVAPFRALGDARRNGQGDVVGLQLCRLGDNFVYDVTVLGRDGRVSHMLFDAHNGAAVPAPRASK